jgi:hypothetical protein
MDRLDRATILAALTALDDRLAAVGVSGEICIYGGSTMVLAFNARLSTLDVDAVFQPAEVIRVAAQAVGEELELPANWLNDGVKGWLSATGEFTTESLPQFGHLRITRPKKPYLLAMKCLAARAAGFDTQGDRDDIRCLVQSLALRSAEEVLEIVERFYPPERILPKTRFLIEEILSVLEPR